MIATKHARAAREACGSPQDAAALDRLVANGVAAEEVSLRRLLAEPWVSAVDLAIVGGLVALLSEAQIWPEFLALYAEKLAMGYVTIAAPAKASA